MTPKSGSGKAKRNKRKSSMRKIGGCQFCQEDTQPDYKEVEALQPFLTDRGKIIGRGRSGLCAKHQRRLAKAVKRARHLALLPFVQRV